MSLPSYLPLSTSFGACWRSSPKNRERRTINKRHWRVLSVLFIVGVTVWYLQIPQTLLEGWTLPYYEEYRNLEDHLPHYKTDAPYPNGRHTKYILFGTHQKGVGWGNVMQEIILNAFLAYSAKRSFVFYDHSWNTQHGVAKYDDRRIPPSIPLSAILSGPLVGGPMDSPDAPQAISENHFRKICPNATILLKEDMAKRLNGATLLQVLDIWVEKLGSMEDRCVEVPHGTPQIFDYMIFGSKEVLNLWPALSRSPIIKHFSWSSLVYAAYDANRHFFEQMSPKMSLEHSDNIPSPPFPPLDGLLALHIRRGDFAEHCDELANWSSDWNGFNRYDELPDKFEVPEGGGWGTNTPENMAIYRKHCYPTIPQITEKLSIVRKKVAGLKRLYIMTNGKAEWVNELILALRTAEEWEAISSTRDLSLTMEEKYVSQALDMYVAQRAEAFVGNGVSVFGDSAQIPSTNRAVVR